MRASAIVGSCIFPSSLPGSVSCQLKAPSLEKSTRDTPSSPSNAMPRPECRSAGLKSMKQSSCAAFGLAAKLPAESAAAGSGPCYAKAQTSPRDRERRGAFPVVRSAPVQVFGRRDDDTIHALLRPASKKRQSTKSREVGHRRCRGRYGDFAAVRDLSAG